MKNKVKLILSVLLTVCMLVTTIPANVLAADMFLDEAVVEAVEEPEVPVENIIPEQDEINEGVLPEQNISTNGDTELANAELGEVEFGSGEVEFDDGEKPELDPFSDGEVEAGSSTTMGTKPSDGNTNMQPFARGTGGSEKFRIPAMVTLNDGTIVAAVDARWNTTLDNGGLDTIVSSSSNNGSDWSYTFANYLGDNGNYYNNTSTAFIDPALATDGSTIYMLVDLFPGGRALTNAADGQPDTANAFDSAGRLLLKKNGDNEYKYYLAGGKIFTSDGNEVTGYTVDGKFNLIQNGSIVDNIFYRNAAYQVVPTTYLYLTKSTDKGATWSEPTLLNVKNEGEAFYGVGPGRGLVTSSGRIIFPCYTHPNEHTSFIYSDDEGETWNRTVSFSDYSSETTLTEADGKLFAFFRCGSTDYADIPYYISYDDGTTWTRAAQNTQIDPCTSCQMSAVTYSKKIDGQTAILLSCPTGNSRNNGKIHVALVNNDGTLNWKYESDVISNAYAYSCLTELRDGSIGLLYESDGGNGTVTYKRFEISDIANGAVIEGQEQTPEVTEQTVTDQNVSVTAKGLTSVTVTTAEVTGINSDHVAYDVTPYVDSNPYKNQAVVKLPLSKTLAALGDNKLTGFVVETDGTITKISGAKTADGLYYTFTAPHFSKMGVMALTDMTDGVGTSESFEIEVGGKKSYTVNGQVGTAGSHTSDDGIVAYTITHTPQTTPGNISVENVTTLTAGTYLIGDGTNWLTWNGTSLGNTTDKAKATEWTVTKNGNGGYTIQNGGTYLTTSDKLLSHELTTGGSKDWSWDGNKFYYDYYGNYYLRRDGTNWSVGRNNSNTGTAYTKISTPDTTTYTTSIAFTGKKQGTTSVEIGGTTYNVTVKSDAKVVDITLIEGRSQTLSVNSDTITTSPNNTIATANITAKEAGYRKTDKLESDKQYLIVNALPERAVLGQSTTTYYDTATGLQLTATNSADIITGDYTASLWTVIANTDGTYGIKSTDGRYLDINSKNVSLSSQAVGIVLEGAGNGRYKIIKGGYSLNNFGSLNTCASGWPTDPGENAIWYFYEYSSGYEMTLTGVKAGNTTMVVGNTTYRITVREQTAEDLIGTGLVGETGQGFGSVVTKLTTSVGMSYDLKLKDALETGQTVEWSSANAEVATVNENGVVTGIAEGTTQVTAKVFDTEHNLVYENTIDVVVLAGNGSNGKENNDKIINLYVHEIKDTKVYYSLNCSNEMVPVQEGEAIYLCYNADSNVAIDFFGAPDKGYALTFMAAPGSAGDYMALHDKTPVNACEFYTKTNAAGFNQIGPFGATNVQNMITEAINQKCDGGMGFTRPDNDARDTDFTLSFRSEKLPEITKEVVALRSEDGTAVKYVPGMSAVVGQEVFFKITVKKEEYDVNAYDKDTVAKNQLIDYTGAKFVDTKLTPIQFYDEDQKLIANVQNGTINFTDTEFDGFGAVTKVYYVGYKVTEKDLDSTISNTATLDYDYKSVFSAGKYGNSADANAEITATSFKPKDIVIDFGLPVTVDFADVLTGNNKTLVSGIANYGTVEVTDTSVKYTPTKILPKEDTVTLTVLNKNSEQKFTVSFKVYPATIVYYEDGFAEYGQDWSGVPETPGLQQTASAVGSRLLYGYDDAYVGKVAQSGGSEHTTSMVGARATFKFTGNGIDIYANCNEGTGIVTIKNNDGVINKIVSVDTAIKDGTTDATNDQQGTAYNVPVASVRNLKHGEYTVTIICSEFNGDTGKNISIDGFRVYNTITDDKIVQDVYAKDNEANPTFVEMRDSVLQVALNADPTDSKQYAKEIARNIMSNVYAYKADSVNALVLDPSLKDPSIEESQVTDLIDNGPKNEIYLKPKQKLIFTTNASGAQLGMKALRGQTNYKITGLEGERTLNTSTDMFYSIPANQEITLENTGSSILSVTKIKLFNAKNTIPITEAFVARALLSMGYSAAPSDKPDKPDSKPTGKPDKPDPTPSVKPEKPEKPSEVTGITLDKTSLELAVGGEAALTAAVVPEDAADKSVSWSVSDKKVVTVDDKGAVKAIGVGTAVITAKSANGMKAECNVTVGLAAPQLGKVVSAGYDRVKITWNKVQGAKAYIIFQKVGSGWRKVGSVNSKTTAFIKKGLACGQNYTFTVKAYAKYKGVVYTAYDENGITGKPSLSTPVIKNVKALRTCVRTTWKKVYGASGYVVYRKTGSGGWKRVAVIKNGSTTGYTDKKVKDGEKYTYTVKAFRKQSGKVVYGGYNRKGKNVKK